MLGGEHKGAGRKRKVQDVVDGKEKEAENRKEAKSVLWALTINNYKSKECVGKFFKNCKSIQFVKYVIAREFGGIDQDKAHLHIFYGLPQAVTFERNKQCFIEAWKEFRKQLPDIASFHDISESQLDFEIVTDEGEMIKYCTKEDNNAVLNNIDFAHTAKRFKWIKYVESNRKLDLSETDRLVFEINSVKIIRRIHSEYWDEEKKKEEILSNVFYRQDILQEISERYKFDKEKGNMTKIGIYVWGKTGTGKTSTAHYLAAPNYIYFDGKSNSFPLDTYRDGDNIIFDDCPKIKDFHKYKYGSLISMITAGFQFYIAHRRKSATTHFGIKYFIITSKFPPPEQKIFTRRFHVICTG